MRKLIHFKKEDEMYTPACVVDPIVSLIDKRFKIWMPFDTEKSEYVKAFINKGNDIVYTHIATGHDFFQYENGDYDIIVSNPPYSCKLKILKRAFELGKPFALLFGLQCLNYISFNRVLINKNIKIMVMANRPTFNGNSVISNSFYLCYNLPVEVIPPIFDNKQNTQVGQFVSSEMEKDREMIQKYLMWKAGRFL